MIILKEDISKEDIKKAAKIIDNAIMLAIPVHLVDGKFVGLMKTEKNWDNQINKFFKQVGESFRGGITETRDFVYWKSLPIPESLFSSMEKSSIKKYW
jgi:hypothetical protein